MSTFIFSTEIWLHLLSILIFYFVFLLIKNLSIVKKENKNVYLFFEFFILEIYSICLFFTTKYVLCILSSCVSGRIFREMTKKFRNVNKKEQSGTIFYTDIYIINFKILVHNISFCEYPSDTPKQIVNLWYGHTDLWKNESSFEQLCLTDECMCLSFPKKIHSFYD